MTESDWKILRDVKPAALERLCGRILEASQDAIRGFGTNHERFLRLFETIQNRNEEIVWAFDRLSRSTADQKLGAMIKLGLVTDEELARFSPETLGTARYMVGIEA
jgi:hypothetical protein